MSAIPETFKEICEAVLEEVDGRGIQLDSVSLGRDSSGNLHLTNPTHRNVVRWVAEEYQHIQMLSPLWSFFNKRGTFLNISTTRSSYTKRNVSRVDEGSLYFLKTGSSARHPVFLRSYDWWQKQEQVDISSTSSVIIYLIDAPNDEWIVWPTPNTAGVLYGDWFLEPGEFIAADDKPCWDKRFNLLLKWGVIKMYAAEFVTESSAPKLVTRADRAWLPLMSAFETEYLPPVRGLPTLV